ncbi:ABC transporter permease [Marivita sp.]|uniref:ABC transporter permease n=1 Tax=Marivita sp. TaxID=2003365 RepID=UPI00262FEADC|nr:ABC transporter permease [Marivita sp.]
MSSARAENVLLLAGKFLSVSMMVLGFVFLLGPIAIVVISSFTPASYLTFPPTGFSLRWYYEVWSFSWFAKALLSSFVISVTATSISAVIGILVARALARGTFRAKAVVELVVLTPLLLPIVVLGFGLFNVLVMLAWEGNNFVNLIAGHVMITVPFVVRSVWSAMAGTDISLEEASLGLGATPYQTFKNVVLPMARPGIISGGILAFTMSFNDVSLSIFLTGPKATTLPVQMMAHIEYSSDPTPAAISTLMLAITLIIFLITSRTVGLKIFA